MPKNLLDRTAAPKLYALVDQVAKANGARRVHALVVDADFNASFQHVGLLRRPVVAIGLPLWSILDPQERVALLSHEFAHGRNNGSLSHGFVGNAVSTLVRLAYLTQPDASEVGGMLLSPLLALISGAFRWLAYLMIALFFQRAQEAEFLADYSAARVGGSAASSSLLRKMALGAYIDAVLVPISFSSDWQRHNFFPAFRDYVATLPPLELERRRRLFERGDFAAHTTHPPSWARLKFVERHGLQPRYLADPKEMAAIDRELELFEEPLTGRLLDAYFPHH
jgi:Zn-dependent protease with chaperone function